MMFKDWMIPHRPGYLFLSSMWEVPSSTTLSHQSPTDPHILHGDPQGMFLDFTPCDWHMSDNTSWHFTSCSQNNNEILVHYFLKKPYYMVHWLDQASNQLRNKEVWSFKTSITKKWLKKVWTVFWSISVFSRWDSYCQGSTDLFFVLQSFKKTSEKNYQYE